MFLTYFDEVKYQHGVQPYYWLGGIMVEAQLVAVLEAQVNELSRECFGRAHLESGTEFHAKDIFHGKANFKGWDAAKRIDVLQRLSKIIDRHDEIYKVPIRLEPARMLASDPEHKAFMFFVERVQMQLCHLNGIGMLIGDHEKSMVGASTYNLSRYREHGTDYQFGRAIDRLIDTVHFTHSHHSRMLQLADVYMYVQQMCAATSERRSWTRTTLVDFIRRETKLLAPHRYKDWPTAQSWYA
jgi:hypothetical protein